MMTDSKIKRKRWKYEDMTPEERFRNLEEAKRQMAGLSTEEYGKFEVRRPHSKMEVVPKEGSQVTECSSCPYKVCGKNRCFVPPGADPSLLVLPALCYELHCPDSFIRGLCPMACPYFVIREELMYVERYMDWEHIEELVAEGIDLKTWKWGDEEDTESSEALSSSEATAVMDREMSDRHNKERSI